MGWDTYSLKDPTFCQPLRVMRGLVSALVERRFPVMSGVYSSAINSSSAYYTSALNRMLNGQAYIDYPFRRAARVGTHSANVGIFAYEMDYQINGLLPYFDIQNMKYCDSNGVIISSIEDLAQMATGSALITTSRFENCLDVEWAKQRQKMLEFLHFTTVDSRALWVERYSNSSASYAETLQSSYNSLRSSAWNRDYGRDDRYRYAKLRYYRHTFGGDYYVESSVEITGLSCVYDGIMMPQSGELRFDAVIDSYYGTFHPLNNVGTKTITSGANVLQLENIVSSGNYASAVFASWGHGNADLNNESCAYGDTIDIGWQMQNVKIIYDYDSVFEFKSLT